MYPGANGYVEYIVPATNVGASGSYTIYVDLSDLPAVWWSNCTGATNIVVTDQYDVACKHYVSTFNLGAKTGTIWFSGTLSYILDTVFRIQVGPGVSTSSNNQAFTDNDWITWLNFEEASGNFWDVCYEREIYTYGTYSYSQPGIVGSSASTVDVYSAADLGSTLVENKVTQTIMSWLKFSDSTISGVCTEETANVTIFGWIWNRLAGILEFNVTGLNNSVGIAPANPFGWVNYASVFDGNLTGNTNRAKLFENAVNTTIGAVGTIPDRTPSFNDQIFYLGYYGLSAKVAYDVFHINYRAFSTGELLTQYNAENHKSVAFYSIIGTWTTSNIFFGHNF